MTARQKNNGNGWKFVTAILIILGLMGTMIAINAGAISNLKESLPKDYVQKERLKTEVEYLRCELGKVSTELSKIQAKLDTLIMREVSAMSHDRDRPN